MSNNFIEVYGGEAKALKLFPSDITEEITQNIKVILTTIEGTVPLDRGFGINAEFIDEPHPKAVMRLAINVAESIQEHEPRVLVEEVEFLALPGDAADGRLFPKVKVVILDEYAS